MPSAAAAHHPARPLPFERLPAMLRPSSALMRYYAVRSFSAGPAFFVLMLLGWFKYRTLRYDLDDQGITARWGMLFRREVSLTYARIQDIHLTSNVIERWLGLAKIQVQTASGSASAELTIEGVHGYDALRDFLYSRMRGAKEGRPGASPVAGALTGDVAHDLERALRDVAGELRALRESLAVERRDA